ncbi:Lrp/AsnC family transcriptional regulator [Sanguibacter hominis ATCC BAA-789]|uniref:Lrp/AsnC family transcriptional regulator n=1 Tax=Sanguibacter hominis ATCC BAA-789 TaxID=1312740 RepID=A0A9X5FFK3_9MICO|nr:Lrp/AsnC ligand binding domain-containing protein [Sanguibacter hominis]NKX93181.1 Lrp/AsnC family transcriptional regulator [Sanguibacter hominis ATCC BAA-789]
MITAFVMIDAIPAQIPEVAAAVTAIDGVSEVYSVTGDTDLIAIVRVRNHDELAEVIADGVNKIPGITRTLTNLAFRTYSADDLDHAFDLGLGD